MVATSGWRTTSTSLKWIIRTSSSPSSTRMACTSPLRVPFGRSIWVTSPVTTTRLPGPMRVRNIFICSGVVFWASSRMTKASLSVRPRINAKGATSTTPCFIKRSAFSNPRRSCSAS
jgi:hypothetical protein